MRGWIARPSRPTGVLPERLSDVTRLRGRRLGIDGVEVALDAVISRIGIRAHARRHRASGRPRPIRDDDREGWQRTEAGCVSWAAARAKSGHSTGMSCAIISGAAGAETAPGTAPRAGSCRGSRAAGSSSRATVSVSGSRTIIAISRSSRTKGPASAPFTPLACTEVRKRAAASSVEKTPSEMALSGRIETSLTPWRCSCAMRSPRPLRSLTGGMKTQWREISSTRRSESRSPSASAANAVRARGASAAAMPENSTHAAPARFCTARCASSLSRAAIGRRRDRHDAHLVAIALAGGEIGLLGGGGEPEVRAESGRGEQQEEKEEAEHGGQAVAGDGDEAVEHEVVLEDRGIREPRGDLPRGAPGQDDTAHGGSRARTSRSPGARSPRCTPGSSRS